MLGRVAVSGMASRRGDEWCSPVSGRVGVGVAHAVRFAGSDERDVQVCGAVEVAVFVDEEVLHLLVGGEFGVG